jgi:hypothetical protein
MNMLSLSAYSSRIYGLPFKHTAVAILEARRKDTVIIIVIIFIYILSLTLIVSRFGLAAERKRRGEPKVGLHVWLGKGRHYSSFVRKGFLISGYHKDPEPEQPN